MARYQRSPKQLIATLRGQLSCSERLLLELMAVYGEKEIPLPACSPDDLRKLGDQAFDLQVALEDLRNSVDEFGDRVRDAYNDPAVEQSRDPHHWLEILRDHLRVEVRKHEFEKEEVKLKCHLFAEAIDYETHRTMSPVLARKRA